MTASRSGKAKPQPGKPSENTSGGAAASFCSPGWVSSWSVKRSRDSDHWWKLVIRKIKLEPLRRLCTLFFGCILCSLFLKLEGAREYSLGVVGWSSNVSCICISAYRIPPKKEWESSLMTTGEAVKLKFHHSCCLCAPFILFSWTPSTWLDVRLQHSDARISGECISYAIPISSGPVINFRAWKWNTIQKVCRLLTRHTALLPSPKLSRLPFFARPTPYPSEHNPPRNFCKMKPS